MVKKYIALALALALALTGTGCGASASAKTSSGKTAASSSAKTASSSAKAASSAKTAAVKGALSPEQLFPFTTGRGEKANIGTVKIPGTAQDIRDTLHNSGFGNQDYEVSPGKTASEAFVDTDGHQRFKLTVVNPTGEKLGRYNCPIRAIEVRSVAQFPCGLRFAPQSKDEYNMTRAAVVGLLGEPQTVEPAPSNKNIWYIGDGGAALAIVFDDAQSDKDEWIFSVELSGLDKLG